MSIFGKQAGVLGILPYSCLFVTSTYEYDTNECDWIPRSSRLTPRLILTCPYP